MPGHELDKALCDHSSVRVSPPLCWSCCLMCLSCFIQSLWCGCVSVLKDNPTGRVPRRPHPHILMMVAFSGTFTHTISISCEKADSWKLMFSLHLSSCSFPHTHTHTPVNPRILTYLSSSGTHTCTVKTPHRTRDCSKTILYSYEQVSALWFSLYFSHMNTK